MGWFGIPKRDWKNIGATSAILGIILLVAVSINPAFNSSATTNVATILIVGGFMINLANQ